MAASGKCRNVPEIKETRGNKIPLFRENIETVDRIPHIPQVNLRNSVGCYLS